MDHPLASLNHPGLRRLAAAGAVAHIAAFVAAVAITGQPVIHEGQERIEHSLVEGGVWPVMAAMFLLLLGFLALLLTISYLTAALGRRTAAGSLAATVARATGVMYVTIIVGVGLSAGAAGLWALNHGTGLDTVLAVNNVRNFAYFAATPVMAACALSLGITALSDRALTKRVGWGGLVVGIALLLAVPAAAMGIAFAQPLWLLWWLGVAVSLWRSSRGGETLDQVRARRGTIALSHQIIDFALPAMR